MARLVAAAQAPNAPHGSAEPLRPPGSGPASARRPSIAVRPLALGGWPRDPADRVAAADRREVEPPERGGAQCPHRRQIASPDRLVPYRAAPLRRSADPVSDDRPRRRLTAQLHRRRLPRAFLAGGAPGSPRALAVPGPARPDHAGLVHLSGIRGRRDRPLCALAASDRGSALYRPAGGCLVRRASG